MGITCIKRYVNNTRFRIAFLKLEDRSNRGTIEPHNFNDKETWIPWCDDHAQFSTKALILEINEDMRIYIWQKGNAIYYYKFTPFSTQMPYVGPIKPLIHPVQPSPAPAGDIFNYGIVAGPVDGDRNLVITERPNSVLINYFDIQLEKI